MHHIIVKVNLFFLIFIASYSYRLRINISMKKHRHSFSKLPTGMPFMVYWHLTWRGNRLYFGPGLLGTLGIVFSTIACMSMSWLRSRGPAPKAEKNAEPCIFHCTYAQNEHVHFFYLLINLLIDAPVPTFYDISYKVLAPFIFLHLPHHILISFGSKASRFLCPSSQRRTTRSLYFI